MKYDYPIYRLNSQGNLNLWDGPSIPKQTAEILLKKRQREYPKEKFFIVRMKES